MAPRRRRVTRVPSQVVTPAPIGTVNVPAQRSGTHTRPQDEDQFDLDAVSGSEDESDHGRDANPTALGESSRDHIQVNDPDTVSLPKTAALDIRYFFDKSGDSAVCNICRQFFLPSWLFIF
jgi:hypothetical protein